MAQVQAKASDNGGSATTVVVSGLSASGAGNCLIAILFNSGGGADVISGVADDQSQSWTKFGGTHNWGLSCWYKANTAAGVTSVTVTFSGARYANMLVIERNDIPTSSVEAATQTITQDVGTFTTWSSGNSGVPSQASCIAYGMAEVDSVTPAFAASGSWSPVSATGLTSGERTSSGGIVTFWEEQVLSSASAVAATGTCNSISYYDAGVWVFKLNASGIPVAWWTA
jgi:hypothetical protein